MRIKRIIALACVSAIALASAACSPDDQAANEAYAQQVLASIRAGAAVAVSTIKSGVDAVCASTQAVNIVGAAAGGIINIQVGANSTQNAQNLNTALAVIDQACTVAATNPTSPALRTLFKQAMAAYAVVKARGI